MEPDALKKLLLYNYDIPNELIHDFSVDIEKLKNPMLLDTFNKLCNVQANHSNSFILLILVNTLITYQVLVPARNITIDNVLKEL